MRRALVSVATLVTLLAGVAQAGPPFGCCICFVPGVERPSSCAATPSPQVPDFANACGAQGGTAQCTASLTADACDAGFARADCFATAGAPVAGDAALLAIAVLLGAGGVYVLRRRRSIAES